VPSKFEFTKHLFGLIQDNQNWLNESLILTNAECFTLIEITNSLRGKLLYRATRDGFGAQEFHSRCDGKRNTITIIMNDQNFVFGGYGAMPWNSSGNWITDPNAFIFSLRRNGVSCNHKLMNKIPEYALFGHTDFGKIKFLDFILNIRI
jgi:hypothetical protein